MSFQWIRLCGAQPRSAVENERMKCSGRAKRDIWSAAAERSGDAALVSGNIRSGRVQSGVAAALCRRFALPPLWFQAISAPRAFKAASPLRSAAALVTGNIRSGRVQSGVAASLCRRCALPPLWFQTISDPRAFKAASPLRSAAALQMRL